MTIHEKIYNYYYNLQSKEMREDILSWKPMKIKGANAAIKITFKNNEWLRVIYKDGNVNWY